MKALLRSRWAPELALIVILIVAPFIAPHINADPDTLGRILIWGLFGLGFDLLFGFTGMLSFGQSAFYGTGGFIAAYLLVHQVIGNVILGLVIGTIGAAAIGFVIGLIALRRTGIYFAMITVAIAEMFFFVENNPLADWTGGENGIPGVPAPVFGLGSMVLKIHSGWSMYGFLAVVYVLGLIVARRIARSPVGHILTAIRDNPLRAAALGHAIWRYKLLVFVVAAAFGGLAGGLLGILQGFMPPEAFIFDTSGQLVIQTVIGGAGTLFGALAGAAIWLSMQDFLQFGLGLGASWRLGLGIVFVVLIVLLRRGVLPAIGDQLRPWWNRVTADAKPASDGAAHPVAVTTTAVATKRLHKGGQAVANGATILETRGITKAYGGLVANSDITFKVSSGELRGVIGPNGAGKSTFFKMLTGEVIPSSGQIFFKGNEITGHTVTDICQLGLSKSYQINQLFSKLTVRQNLLISALAESRGRFRLDLLRHVDAVPGLHEDVAATLDLVNLVHRADVPVADLAYGEKRRLEIGLALATAPNVLLLDEPLAGMSPQERVDTVNLIKNIRKGRTVILVEHDMDAVFDLAERITVLHQGRVLAEGTPAEIQKNSFVQDAYLGGLHAE
ncbi:MAG TPA: branched-chain amino acid ABC transporter ATP-binding protein/permease [Magnetospirillaceae bacterium]|jgi:branched-chain amino acid transport system permease protein